MSKKRDEIIESSIGRIVQIQSNCFLVRLCSVIWVSKGKHYTDEETGLAKGETSKYLQQKGDYGNDSLCPCLCKGWTVKCIRYCFRLVYTDWIRHLIMFNPTPSFNTHEMIYWVIWNTLQNSHHTKNSGDVSPKVHKGVTKNTNDLKKNVTSELVFKSQLI